MAYASWPSSGSFLPRAGRIVQGGRTRRPSLFCAERLLDYPHSPPQRVRKGLSRSRRLLCPAGTAYFSLILRRVGLFIVAGPTFVPSLAVPLRAKHPFIQPRKF